MTHPTLTQAATKYYRLNAYADGYGNWHCEIMFNFPMGNTNIDHAILVNSIRHAKKAIREELTQRNNNLKPKLRYQITANRLTPQNQITYLRVSEIG